MSSERLTFQPPHTLYPKEVEYINQRTPREKQLHELATQMLGSSYFVGKTHGFKAWEAKQSNPNKQPQGAK